MKKILLILALISMLTMSVFALTGTYTTNEYFYLPGYGEYGSDAFDEYETYMEVADNQIEANKAMGEASVDTSGTPVDNDIAVFTDLNTIEGLNYAELKAVLNLEIGTDIQAYDAGLLSIAALTTAANKSIYTTALDTYAVYTLTAFARTILDDANASTVRSTIGVDLSLYYLKTEMDEFSELQSIISDKTLINEEDAVIFDETVSMVKELDITGALAAIDINPAGQTSQNIVDITPTATLNATQIWCGYNINGALLDPNGVDTEIIGYNLDFSGVSETNFPIIHGYRSKVPFGQDAFHIREGQLHIDTVLPSTVASEFTTIDIVIDSSALASTSEYHAIDVATTGTPSGETVALGTHTGIEVVHQHIATFDTPSQTEFAGIKHTNGTVWVDGIDAYGVIFAAVTDAIYVGSLTQFDEIEVIMTTGGTKSTKPTFWYNTAADAWTQFFPADDTDGFQQSGEVRWEVAAITATWTNNGDPGGADTTAGYWIKIVRTRAGTVGSPDPATVKIGLVTEYKWDKAGNVVIKSLDLNNGRATEVKTIEFNGVYAIGNSGATETVDWQNGAYQSITLDEACVISFSNEYVGTLNLEVTYAGSFALTFDGGITLLEEGGVEIVTTDASGVDVLMFKNWGTADTYVMGALLDVKD